jgi:serine/threonine protein kinase/tetratricopeptide (TPR) repeat protein
VTEREIFVAALEIDNPADRHDYLATACGSDTALRGRVDRLLNALGRAGNFLQTPPAADALLGLPTPQPADAPGNMVGPYKLLEQIGEGGMGLVFMAEQTRPVKRLVALKVLKPGLDSRQVVARFEAERQALALMDHPNIARIIDGGTTDSGRPYFIMELVRGVPITDFCDERKLTTRQRLELFVQVCAAVQHAHQKGVIHRDLKPSNVLVTLHDTVAVPKVIDFGIAKATSQPLTDRTLFTHFAQMVGTPLYMSPEQAEMNGLDVDTRSDVYSLGVLLYELLTGTTPFEQEALRKAGLDEMRRMIREQEPPSPSQRLNTLDAQSASTVSERRGVDGRRLGQLLRGELDWVVMRALEKDRDRRYESASALAADVQRYLADEPVAACPPSAGYRLRKFWRRNRRALVTAGVIAAALVAATVVSTWQAIDANTARKLADERLASEQDARLLADERLDNETIARRQAATDAAIARAVTDFLQRDLLRQVASEPRFGEPGGDNPFLTVREALDRSAARIDERFRDQPLVEAAIRMAIGDGYFSLDETQQAALHLKRAVGLRREHLGPDHQDTLDSMGQLAAAYTHCGCFKEAIDLRQQLLERYQARFGADDPRTLAQVEGLAGALSKAGQWESSARLRKQLLDKQRATGGPPPLDIMHHLALDYAYLGKFPESIALHEKVLEALKAQHSSGHGALGWPLTTFGVTCQRAQEFDRADRLFQEALEDYQPLPDSFFARGQIAQVRSFWTQNLYLQQRYAEAEPLLQETLAWFDKFQPDRPERFYWMNLRGAVLAGQQRYQDAEPLLVQGYEEMKKRETLLDANWRTRVPQAGERVVRFYEATNQPEKAREWREKLAATPPKQHDP